MFSWLVTEELKEPYTVLSVALEVVCFLDFFFFYVCRFLQVVFVVVVGNSTCLPKAVYHNAIGTEQLHLILVAYLEM